MPRFFLLVFITSILLHSKTHAQDSIQARIILIGDAGELTHGKQPVVSGARRTIPFDEKTTVIFLGDNAYESGLPDDLAADYNSLKAVLDSQIFIAEGTKAKVYMMPGNHDWNDGKPRGYEYIVRQQQYVDNAGSKNTKFYPEDGCPGPVEISITPDVTLIIMDSQWWVHPFDKPGVESDCPYKTKAEVLTQLDDILSRNSKKLVLITFHHTLRSFGIHGGYYTLKQYIFPFTDMKPKWYIPLPVIGTIYPITRGVFGTSEDLSHPLYASMIADIGRVVKGHQNVIFAAGHEHTLQLIKDSGYYYIVTGAGSKSTRVNKNKKLMFGVQDHGFVTLDISKNKDVSTTFYTVDTGTVKKAYTAHLLNFSGIPTPENPNDTLREVESAFKDSVVISASDKYKSSTKFKRIFLGNNYRPEWNEPVKFKVFNLRREKGGFRISSLGGGKQTKSLRLIDKNGKEWTLRSVDKDPEKAIPANLRGTLAQRILQDLITASNPYAALVVPTLSKAQDILEAGAEYFFVPDDPAFGIYRPIFANTVCLLEKREPATDAADTKTTAKVISKLIDDHDNHIDEHAYLTARLLDNVVADWDRHSDQWKWGTTDTGKGKLYYPVPRDRDQAFFNSDGVLLNYLSKNQFKYLQGFKDHIYDVRWLNWSARDIDRIFMTRLNSDDWKNVIQNFQKNLPDRIIDSAVKKLPPEIYKINAASLSQKLKQRRDVLMSEEMKYYKFISRKVNILGSNDQEYFRVRNAGKDLQVTVYRKNKHTDSAGIIYNRIFDPKITREVRLFGFKGDDKFEIENGTSSKIKVRMIGGKGDDTFNIKGNVRNFIYDFAATDTGAEKNTILNQNKTEIEFSSRPQVNDYKSYGYNYNVYRFPQLSFGYNSEDKLLLGFGFSAKTFGFRKDPYETFQRLSALYALSKNAYHINYEGVFNDVLFRKDILFNAELVTPVLDNFYGFGDSTTKWAGADPNFYKVRYKTFQTSFLLRKRLNSVLDVSFGPAFYNYTINYNDNKTGILAKPLYIGTDSANIYSIKNYFGAKLKIDINFVNDEAYPSRGITWYNELSSMAGLNNKSKSITKLTSDMTVYASLSEERKLVSILRLGAGTIFNKSFDYFQALNLGENNYLRGFRKDRFSGSSLFYSSLEIRKRLFRSQSYILPGDVGLTGFYDLGRVWMKGQTTHQWHQSYGGGVYFSPFNILVIQGTVGISDEDRLLNFSLGTKFRLMF